MNVNGFTKVLTELIDERIDEYFKNKKDSCCEDPQSFAIQKAIEICNTTESDAIKIQAIQQINNLIKW